MTGPSATARWRSGENVVAFAQRIALPGFGLDLVALISESLDSLPDSTPGKAQLSASASPDTGSPGFLQVF